MKQQSRMKFVKGTIMVWELKRGSKYIVSNELRTRVIVIDDIFINENGINMYFNVFNGLNTEKKSGLHNEAKLFAKWLIYAEMISVNVKNHRRHKEWITRM